MSLGRSSDLSVGIDGDAAGLERACKSADAALARSQRAALNYDASLAKLGGDISRLEKQLEDDLAGALDRQHQAMTKTGRGMVVFGAAVAAGLGLAGREAMKWESAWAGVTKTVDGSDREMAVLEDQLRSLAKTLPSTHEEIAAVAEAAGQLGVERESVAKFTKTMIDLGETTNLSANDAATGLARFSNIMGTSVDDADKLGSVIVGLGNNFETTEAEILAMSLRIAGTGRQIGMTEGEVMGLAAALSSVGIEAEAGGSAVSQIMKRIQSSVSEGGAELEKFARVAGVTGPEFAQAFGTDAAGALDMFITGLGGVSAAGGDTLATLSDLEFTQIRQSDVLLRLSGNAAGVTAALAQGNTEWAANNALQEEAAKRYATTEAKAKIAGNALRDNAIDIGAYVLPAIAALSENVANLAAFFGGIPGPVKATVVVVAALAAAAALAGGAFLIAVPKIHAFNTALAGMQAGALKTAGTRLAGLGSVLMGPWGIALAAATIGVGMFAAKQGDATRAVDALKATLDEQTGAITENSQQWAIKELSDSGALQSAKDLGLNLGLVTDAALGNKSAIAELNTQLDEYALVVKSGEGAMSARTEGDAEAANAARELREALGGTNETLDEARTKWELENEAKGESAGASKDAAAATSHLTGVTDRNSDGLVDNTDALLENIEAMQDKRSEALRAANAEIGYQAALDDARAALKDNGKSLDITTEKGRANKTALLGVADAWNDLSDKAKNAPGAHKAAIDSFVRIAVSMGMGEDRARALAKRIHEIPPKNVKIDVDTADGLAKVAELDRAADAAAQARVLQIRVDTLGQVPAAVGSPVTRRADGGWINGPGGPRDDKILARLSNGEFVVNADSADRYGPLLEAINAKRFADGGFVGGKATSISAPFLLGQMGRLDPVPNLGAYNRALRAQAAALQVLRREEKELAAARRAARAASKAEDKADTPANRKAARVAARELEKAENQAARAKDRHAKATGRVKDAVNAYAAAQAEALSRAGQVADQAASGGTIFGSDFSDPASVQQRIQATLARVKRFIAVRRKLVAKGISPFLLSQLDDEGPTESAIMFGEDLLRQPDLFRDLNTDAGALTTASARLGADTAALHGPRSGREVRTGPQTGQTIIIHQTVNAPQGMNARQVGDMAVSRLVAKVKKR